MESAATERLSSPRPPIKTSFGRHPLQAVHLKCKDAQKSRGAAR